MNMIDGAIRDALGLRNGNRRMGFGIGAGLGRAWRFGFYALGIPITTKLTDSFEVRRGEKWHLHLHDTPGSQ